MDERKKMHRFTKAEKLEILRLRIIEQETWPDIATAMKTDRTAVRQSYLAMLRNAEVPKRQKLTNKQIERIRYLYRSGKSIRTIKEETGHDPATIRKYR